MKTVLASLMLALLVPDLLSAAEPPLTPDLHWRMIGPFRGGRTRAVTGIPGRAGTILIGAVDGGVWQTTDYGRTWQPLFDAQPTQSIGAIAVAPSDPNIIYVGSGEGLHRPDLAVGDGLYRSMDSGKTWTHSGLEDAQQIPELAIDPHDPNRVYAAVLGHPFGPNSERGIYRSVNGGRQWTRVLFTDENTGGYCVSLDPFNPDVVFAGLWNVRSGPWEDNNEFSGAGSGLYKSTDGGEHWRRLTKGLPEKLAQIQVTVAPNRQNRLYAAVATEDPGDYSSGAGLGVYRSDDGGETWSRITTDARPALRIGGGDLPILRVDPHNADVVYSASLVTMKSVDGGVSWSALRGSPGGDDYQNLWISPDDSKVVALVSDQGAVVTVNGGATWSSWLNQPTAQLYHIGVSNFYPYRVCSGQQESGSVCISSRGNDGEITFRDWHPVGVIEYGYVVPDPLDPDVVFGAGRNEVTRTDLATGQTQNITPIPLTGADLRADRTEPLFFAPQDPHRLYYAANRLYETVNGGQSWRVVSPDLTRPAPGVPASVGALHSKKAEGQRGVIYAASASPVQAGLIWLGTDDGLIWKRSAGTADAVAGEAAWTDVTPPELTPWSKVTQLEASHFDPLVAFASVSRFRVDDLKPYIYRTSDGGAHWQLINDGLPADAPVNTVREDPVRRGLLFAGTEKAVWMSKDNGEHWSALQLNLPHTSMRDLAVHDQDLIVATHGRSFWILDDISPLRQFDQPLAGAEAALLKPAAAIRAQRDTNNDTPIQPDEPTGLNPPDGAVLDYYLAHDARGEVTVEIFDDAGKLMRRFSSNDPPAYTPDRLAHELIPLYWLRRSQALATTGGFHRWVWDLHEPAPRTARRGFPIAAIPFDTPEAPLGPLVAPGHYRVRLSVGTLHWDQPLQVTADPRLQVSAAALAEQWDLAQRLAAALDHSTAAVFEARSLQAQVQSQLQALAARNTSADRLLAEPLRAYAGKLTGILGGGAASPEEPTVSADSPRELEHLNTDLGVLYDQVTRADAAPTAAQSSAATRAISDWQTLEGAWRQLRDADCAALNRTLRRAKLVTLRPELAPPEDLDQADME